MKTTSLLIIFLSILLCTACGQRRAAHDDIRGTVITTDARLLKLVDCGDYMYAEVRASEADSQALAKYVIVDSGALAGTYPEDCIVINAPLKRSVVSSSVHTAGIAELGKIGAIAGVSDVSYYLPDDPVAVGVREGKIADAGASFSPDIEKIIDLGSDGLVITPYEGEGYNSLKKLGIPMALMTDYLESTPLGRAEWILLIGALYGRFDEAQAIYKDVRAKYQSLRECAAGSKEVPLVITEKPMSGVWYVPGGNSYVAAMISDASATYPWAATTESGSIPLDVSAVIDAGGDAAFWLIKDAKDIDRSSLLAELPHAKAFKSFPGNVYVCNTIKAPYFNAAAFHPELILADMVAIFHNGKCPTDSTLRFFKPLE